MKDFKKSFGGNRGGGDRPERSFERRPFSGGRSEFRGNDRDRRPEMHKATCANCGKACEVPFRPNGEKPVYCSDCFGKQREGGDMGASNFPRKEFGRDREDTYKKPERAPVVEDKRIDNLVRQLDMANSKLDRLMDMVRAGSRPAIEAAEKAKVATPAPAVADKKAMKVAPKAKAEKAVVKKVAAPAKKVVAKKKK